MVQGSLYFGVHHDIYVQRTHFSPRYSDTLRQLKI